MIYILANANAVSGGPELSHQLCHKLADLGYNSKMIYFNKLRFPSKKVSDELLSAYSCYNCNIAEKLEDKCENSIIIPETCLYFLPKFKHMKKVIWWMSVDNYYITMRNPYAKFYAPFGMNSLKYNPFINDYIHCYQSEYARQFLLSKGINEDKIVALSDYLSEEFIDGAINENNYEKLNNVLYNPKKGFFITEKIIKLAPSINWIPLEGMTHSQMAQLMMKSKVYIDFGNHPGKDRIPREAAICGCCIITNCSGSAENSIDVPIRKKFKYNLEECELSAIIDRIYECMNNYEINREEFAFYRRKIRKEEEIFNNEVKILGKMLEG